MSYIALGDSYAAGLGSVERLGLCDDDSNPASATCTIAASGKDTVSYAYVLTEKHSLMNNFQYLACSGADTSAVIADQVNTSLTVQVGGDDFHGFFSIILGCVVFANDTMCQQALTDVTNEMDQILRNVDATLQAINDKTGSSVRKLLLGYVDFFGTDYDRDCTVTGRHISAESRRAVNGLTLKANWDLSRTANMNGFDWVEMNPSFDTHR